MQPWRLWRCSIDISGVLVYGAYVCSRERVPAHPHTPSPPSYYFRMQCVLQEEPAQPSSFLRDRTASSSVASGRKPGASSLLSPDGGSQPSTASSEEVSALRKELSELRVLFQSEIGALQRELRFEREERAKIKAEIEELQRHG
eukprot:Opistho-2@62555